MHQREPITQHMVLRFIDDRVFAPNPAAQRKLARIVLRQGRPFSLLSFGGADTHLHVLPYCDLPRATELDRRLKIQIKLALHPSAVFARTSYTDVFDEWHLAKAFRYDIVQARHHGCNVDPFFETTVLPDLLGLRLIEGRDRMGEGDGSYVIANVASYLPRVSMEQLWSFFEGPRPDLTDDELVWDDLEQAAAAAVALPDVTGKTPAACAARAAAIQLAARTLIPDRLAKLLGCSTRTLWRGRRAPLRQGLLEAVRMQLALRSAAALRRRALPPAEQAWKRAAQGRR